MEIFISFIYQERTIQSCWWFSIISFIEKKRKEAFISQLKINEQTNNNECGICVAKSLIQYFHHKNISKEELYNQVEIDENGISIYALENLLARYHIHAESYETTLEELQQGNFHEPMVTLINNGEGLHFVIIRMQKNKVLFYDSALGKYEKTLEEFGKV